MDCDMLLLQETWLSNETCCKLHEISSDFIVLHTSAMENKLCDNYLCGRPFGGTALMYSKHLSCKISQVDTNNPRCTAIKLKLDNSCDVVIVSVYMPCLNNTTEQRIEYENTIGCLQGIIDRNLGCNFVFGGDFNVSKKQSNANVTTLHNFCSVNGLLWLDPVSSGVNYTYHADTNRQYSLIDHMLVSPHLIENQESVDIHVDDHNASDHYAISVSLKTESTNMEKDKLRKYKTLKYMWNNADIYGYAKSAGGAPINSCSSENRTYV